MTPYFLGVDVGGTKSHVLITNASGCALVLNEGGCGNPDMVGLVGLTSVIAHLVQDSLRQAGISMGQVEAAGIGISGYDWPSQSAPIHHALLDAGIQAPFAFVNDVELGLLAGTQDGWGVVIEAGTGCNCRGRDRNGREGRVVGYGMKFGERAGAMEIVAESVNAIAREWTRRGPPTALTPAFVQKSGASGAADFLEKVALNRCDLDPSLATLVFQLAEEGDEESEKIIQWAGRGLGDLMSAVVRQLEIEAVSFEAVMIGSLFRSQRLIQAMKEEIIPVAPGARLVQLGAPPVVGGVLLAMQQAGVEPQRLRDNVVQSTLERLA